MDECEMEPPYFRVDFNVGAAYMHLSSEQVSYTLESDHGMLIDYTADCDVVGIEFMDSRVMEIFGRMAQNLADANNAEAALSLLRATWWEIDGI